MDLERADGGGVNLPGKTRAGRNPDDDIRGAAGVSLDVSEQVRAELALQESEALFRGFFDLASVGLTLVDTATGQLQRVNGAYCRLTGYSETELLGKPFTEITHPDDRARDWAIYTGMVRGESAEYRNEKRYIRKDGRVIWVSINATILRNAFGAPERSVGVVEDITERKLAESTLRDSEARLRMALDAACAGLWSLDIASGNLDFCGDWRGHLGSPEADLPLQWLDYLQLLHPDDRAGFEAALRDVANGPNHLFDLEYRIRHTDGRYRWIQFKGSLTRDETGKPTRLLGLNLDVTDHKSSRDLRVRREQHDEFMKRNVARQTLATIAHELNQPLMALASYAAAANALAAADAGPHPLRGILDNIVVQATRAGEVVKRLTDALQHENTTAQPFPLDESLAHVVALLHADEKLSGFQVARRMEPHLPHVNADPSQVEKVLINLLRNAMEAMQSSGHAGGEVQVCVGRAGDDPSMVKISVADTAGTVDEATIGLLFKPFYSTKPLGLGMGLAISRTLVQAQGGKIWAERNAAAGLSVHFTLPLMP